MAKGLKDRFPNDKDIFTNFLSLKTAHRDYNKGFAIRTFDPMTMAPRTRWLTEAATGTVSMGLFNLVDRVFALCKEGDAAKHYLKNLRAKVALLSKPTCIDSTVWVWIVVGSIVNKHEKLEALI